ncbi:molybdopterin molybdotransferase [Virgibacillus natechei]|uniref:Molybdopterin molybdenumtransferase n=1 Tax=Virgibacillus natechei TaxID=1216297 RepID=A0ABS4IG25_9BACI|nr:gephyrin-like molybdotransferase Glp [Virgibacillus natechei]MBP1969899.1 molybdopterin molybdotransferase [Virgibacillus natechei]UZD13435.1 molybdopterin molybdotransferase MoeA [Virgibacillus natechei]
MVERRKPIKVDEAIIRVMEYAEAGSVQHVPIEESYGHFLGEDLVADHPVPPFDRSPYDGFAIRSTDTATAASNNPVLVEVIGEIGAGSLFEQPVGRMQAVRIMTGAQIPETCDAVVMFESVKEMDVDGKKMIRVKRRFKAGDNVSFTGEDTNQGEILAYKGTSINPGIVALLATFGYKNVPVSKKPKVGIIATGSELLEVDQEIQPGKIRNSNAYMVYAQVERAGGEPVYFGQFSDDFETCFEQVTDTLEKVDILITTGGVSVGDYDYLPDIYEKMNANVLFNKVGMRPGSVTTVAEKEGKLLFGLSGNPSACYVGFELFTRPIIRTFLHASRPISKKEIAILGADFPKPNPFDRFVRGSLSYTHGKLVATPVGLDKSSVVSSLGEANILIVLPSGTRGYKQGMEVSVILLEDQEGATLEAVVDKEGMKKGSMSHG